MLKNKITSIAIGGFDGMHLAHQELFKKLDKNGAIVVIETGYANLTPKTYRAKYTSYPIFYYPLENIKYLSCVEFINLLKEEYPNLKKIVVGFDFKFGFNATGGVKDLKELFDGQVIIIDEYRYEGEAVHSKVIRDLLSKGEIKKASKFLNKNYTIEGSVIKGQGLGKKQFVPTINILCEDFLLPCEGVYASYTTINNIKYLSATFIGHRLTTDKKYSIETHIIDTNLDSKYSNIQIEFIDKIRDNKRFENFEDLKLQIAKDIKIIKANY